MVTLQMTGSDATLFIVLVVVALVVGFGLGFILLRALPTLKNRDAQHKAERILREAEIKAEQIKKNATLPFHFRRTCGMHDCAGNGAECVGNRGRKVHGTCLRLLRQ